jgi:hypothetical protein
MRLSGLSQQGGHPLQNSELKSPHVEEQANMLKSRSIPMNCRTRFTLSRQRFFPANSLPSKKTVWSSWSPKTSELVTCTANALLIRLAFGRISPIPFSTAGPFHKTSLENKRKSAAFPSARVYLSEPRDSNRAEACVE